MAQNGENKSRVQLMIYYLAVVANYNSLSPNRQEGEVVARRAHSPKD